MLDRSTLVPVVDVVSLLNLKQSCDMHKYCCASSAKKTHVMKKELCPAYRKTCDSCRPRNHFRGSEMCKPSVHIVHDDSDDSYNSISSVTAELHTISCKMRLNQQDVTCKSTVVLL